jgi:type II secretory pathway component PulF
VVVVAPAAVVVVFEALVVPQAANIKAATANPAPTFQAALSPSLRCIWLSSLLISTTLLAPARSVPPYRETTALRTVAHL